MLANKVYNLLAAVPKIFGTRDPMRIYCLMIWGRAGAVMLVLGTSCKYRWSFCYSPAAHLLLCGPVPNRPQTGIGPWPRSWGPLCYYLYLKAIWKDIPYLNIKTKSIILLGKESNGAINSLNFLRSFWKVKRR